ncbi:MAG: spore coat protein H [Psychromonas sp.]|jgi:spore coat protein H|uniref:CotH kinase family protein n=1 Tax=Psychromonas sp. TaxID=1884585 RepID=UPI0039E3A3AC
MKFKKLSIIFGLLYLLVTTASQAFNDTSYLQDPEHQFWFDIDDLPKMRLHFSENQWSLLLSSTSSVREEVSGDMIFIKGGVEYPLSNIGIKISGNTSFVLPQQPNGNYTQANFTLDFDEFVDDQELSGIAKLKLKRFKDDQSYVREPLSNHIMQNFNVWTTHSSTYARLDISVGDRVDVYFGVYRMNESVNRKEYLDKRFGPDNDGGFLWQGNNKAWGKAHFSRINGSWGGVGEFDQASFEYKGKGSKYTQAHAQLVELAQNFSNLEGPDFEDYVALHINIPLLLKGLASEAVLGHWDGFWGNGNNFFIYIDESEVMHFVPYDTDNTLGTSLLVGDAGERNPLEFASANDAPLLVRKILAIDHYSAEYQGYLKDLVTESGLMLEVDSLPWIESVHQLIRDDLKNDTGDNEIINDSPAYWGNESSYRIFDLDAGKNWYETRRDAVLRALNLVENIYSTVYYRGVSNDWGASLMTQVEPNVWRITVTNDPESNVTDSPRFKFDIYADWSQNFGDNGGDGIVDAAGADILFTEGEGEYSITFYAIDGRYELKMLNDNEPEASPEPEPEPETSLAPSSVTAGSSSVTIILSLCLMVLIRRRSLAP